MSSHATTPSPRPAWAWVRLVVGAAVLALLFARVGTRPFLDGVRLTTTWSLAAATAVTALTTLCCAWRWQVVADRLGVRIGLRAAVASVYQAQFLNSTLPGGVLGDVHRAVRHADGGGLSAPGVRSVVWERTLGQVVQVALTLLILLTLPSPVHAIGVSGAILVVLVGVLALGAIWSLRVLRGAPARVTRAVLADARALLARRRHRWTLLVASAGALSGHLVVLLLAANVAGVPASAVELLPLAALVLLAAAVPANVAGWGPREGVAAWCFGAAGLGVESGVTTAVAYGVMALVATLPGAVLLVAGGRRRRVLIPDARPRRVPAEEACCG
jgi:uncharacterized membrane protein YbhN (UPF0104 family)